MLVGKSTFFAVLLVRDILLSKHHYDFVRQFYQVVAGDEVVCFGEAVIGVVAFEFKGVVVSVGESIFVGVVYQIEEADGLALGVVIATDENLLALETEHFHGIDITEIDVFADVGGLIRCTAVKLDDVFFSFRGLEQDDEFAAMGDGDILYSETVVACSWSDYVMSQFCSGIVVNEIVDAGGAVVEVGCNQNHCEFRAIGGRGGELRDVVAVGNVEREARGGSHVADTVSAFLLGKEGGGVFEALFCPVETVVGPKIAVAAGADIEGTVAVGQDDILVECCFGGFVVSYNTLILLFGIVAVVIQVGHGDFVILFQ